MVADMGKGGRNDDEYMPEFSGDTSDHEGFELDNAPLKGIELEPGELAEVQGGLSVGKKVGIGLGVVFAIALVSYYLIHQQKTRIAQQALGTPATATAVAEEAKPAEPKTTAPVATASATNPTPDKESSSIATAALKKPELGAVSATETKPVASAASQLEANAAEMIKGEESTTAATPASSAAVAASATPAASAAEAVPATPAAPGAAAPAAAEATPSTPAVPVATAASATSDTSATATPVAPAVTAATSAAIPAPEASTAAATSPETPTSAGLMTRVMKLDNEVAALATTVAAIDKKLDALQTQGAAGRHKMAGNGSKQKVFASGKHKKIRNRMMSRPMEVPGSTSEVAVTSVSAPSYVVRAIVPGRAWIETSLGGPISVSVGDQIPGMGVVKTLDPALGEVTLESGDVIKYGPDDH